MSLSPLEHVRHILAETAYLSTQAGRLSKEDCLPPPIHGRPDARMFIFFAGDPTPEGLAVSLNGT